MCVTKSAHIVKGPMEERLVLIKAKNNNNKEKEEEKNFIFGNLEMYFTRDRLV